MSGCGFVVIVWEESEEVSANEGGTAGSAHSSLVCSVFSEVEEEMSERTSAGSAHRGGGVTVLASWMWSDGFGIGVVVVVVVGGIGLLVGVDGGGGRGRRRVNRFLARRRS